MFDNISLSNFFISMIEQNPDSDLEWVLSKVCSKFSLINATYFGTGIPGLQLGEHILLTTYPKAWINHYFDQSYEHLDPIIATGFQSILPVDWASIDVKKRLSKQFFGEAAEFGLGHHGMTISVRGAYGDHSLFSINTHAEIQDWIRRETGVISDITYLAHLIHHQVLKRATPAQCIEVMALSHREKEVLRWAALGKTAWETAQITNLAEKTVSFYISNACTKLRVASKTQAVAKAVSERFIIL